MPRKKKRKEGRPIKYDDDFHKIQRQAMAMYRAMKKAAKEIKEA